MAVCRYICQIVSLLIYLARLYTLRRLPMYTNTEETQAVMKIKTTIKCRVLEAVEAWNLG